MAGEIKVNASLEASNGNFKFPKIGATTQSIDQTTAGGGVPGIISAITTGTGTAVSNTGLTALGWCYIRNLDLTNTVEYGPVSGGVLYPFGSLAPGEAAVFRLKTGITWSVIALVAACKVQVLQLDK